MSERAAQRPGSGGHRASGVGPDAVVRAVAVGGAAWGVALLLAPRWTARLIGQAPTTTVTRLARVLGARHLLESGALLATPAARRPVVAVDGLHAASMVVAALRWPGARRGATVSGAVAAAVCVLTARAGKSPA